MSEPTPPVRIAFRIPGLWTHPQELIKSLPDGATLTPDSLTLPDGTEVEFGAAPADDQFAAIFRSSCRNPPTPEELATVDRYKVNVFLAGPGGSLPAARAMMRSAAAVIRAGGAGVFIDNSGLAHGGGDWIAMTDDGGPDALSFAFVSIVAGKTEVWTMGMHALGLREVIMQRRDADQFDIIDVIRYLAEGDKPVENNHIIADLGGPRFRCFTEPSPEVAAGPMNNPFGRLKLVSMRDMAETN